MSLLLRKSIGEGGSRFESTKHFCPLNLIDFWAPSCPCPAVERHVTHLITVQVQFPICYRPGMRATPEVHWLTELIAVGWILTIFFNCLKESTEAPLLRSLPIWTEKEPTLQLHLNSPPPNQTGLQASKLC